MATAVIEKAESIIFSRSSACGIGVGLHPGYNAAQVLYVKLGYIPDGRGLVYKDQYVRQGQTVRMDDDLVLHFVKRLSNGDE